VNSLDDCDLPYGGAPAPLYDGEPSDRSDPNYDEYVRWSAMRPRLTVHDVKLLKQQRSSCSLRVRSEPSSSAFLHENLDVLENPYYVPPLLPEKFEIFLRECSPANSTRSKTQRTRQHKLNRAISPLLNEIRQIYGIENQLVIIDQIYVILKDNMDVLKKNVNLYDVSKLKLDEFIREFPVEAGYLKTLRIQMFG